MTNSVSLKQQKILSSSDPNETSDDDFVFPHRTMSDSSRPCSSSSVSPVKVLPSPKKTPDRRQYLDLKKDVLETQRDRWRQFRERKTRSSELHLRLKKPKQTPIEPSEFMSWFSCSKLTGQTCADIHSDCSINIIPTKIMFLH